MRQVATCQESRRYEVTIAYPVRQLSKAGFHGPAELRSVRAGTTSVGLDGVAMVIVGVDTHLDEHVAVAFDHNGACLGEY